MTSSFQSPFNYCLVRPRVSVQEMVVPKAMRKIPKPILALLASLIALLLLGGVASAQEERLYLAFDQGRMTANIKNTPLTAVLDRIKQQRKIYFDKGFMKDPSLLDNDISLQFKKLPVQDGLERILSGINHSLILKGDSVEGVMLLGEPGKRTYRPSRRTVRRRTPRRSSRRR
jgi:hypothetical protein